MDGSSSSLFPPRVVYVGKQVTKLPIDPDTTDQFYRYQMSQVQIQVIGRGKMIKTSFLNIEDIAKDLKVPPDYIPNFLAQNIGAKAWYDPKKPERERASISGDYPLEDLAEQLARFIRSFILCPQCRLPEISYVPIKKDVGLKCRSCGWKDIVSKSAQLDTKFIRYVINHPPPKTAHLDKSKAERERVQKQKRKEDEKLIKVAAKLDVDKEVEWQTDTSAEAAARRAAEMVPTKMMKEMVLEGDNGGDAGDKKTSPPTSSAAGGSAGANSDNEHDGGGDGDDDDDDDDDDDLEPAAVLAAFVDGLAEPAPDKVLEQAYALIRQDSLADAESLALVVGGLFPSLAQVTARAKPYLRVVKQFVPATQGLRQVQFLGLLEQLYDDAGDADDERATFAKKVPGLFKFFYDADLVSESTFLAWYDAEPNKPLQKAAKQFCIWLKEADSSDSE